MNKKVLIGTIVVGAIAIALSFSQTQAASGYRLKTTDGTSVGDVYVTNDTDNLTISFEMRYNQGYCLQATQVHVADTWQQIPQENGSPAPELFDYIEVHECSETVDIIVPLADWEPGDYVTIAAHAVIGSWKDKPYPGWETTALAAGCDGIKTNPFPDLDCSTYLLYQVFENAEPEPLSPTPILDRVLERGSVICGARKDLLGFGYLDENGENIGFDIDLCRAVAAAVLGDANATEVVILNSADRGPALQNAEVDILSRNTTWTSSRDAQWGNFTIIMFFDGQGFMIRKDTGIETLGQLDGATVCVTNGTTTEQNLASFFNENDMTYEALLFDNMGSVYAAYQEGLCDFTTSDISQMAAVRSGFADPNAHLILDVMISKEPLAPAVPHGDDAWFDIVKLTMFALINAEELGVTSTNVEEMKGSEISSVATLLGTGGDWGYGQYGLDADGLARAIAAVGNYGELYDRYMGPEGDAFTLPRGPNELWSNGGLLYAPPIK